MSNFTVTVVHTLDPAIQDLLRGLLQSSCSTNVVTPQQPASAPAAPPVPTVSSPIIDSSQPPTTAPAPPTAPTAAPATAVPAVPPVPVVAAVPTAPPTFTHEQISQAAALFADNDTSRQAVYNLIQQYGVPSISELPNDKIGSFATDLRALGVKI